MRWTRPELKTRAKQSIKRFYAGAVIACFIMLIISGGFANNSVGNSNEEENASNMHSLAGLVKTDNEIADGAIQKTGELLSDNVLPPIVSASLGLFVGAMSIIVAVVAIFASLLLAGPIEIGVSRYFMVNRERKTTLRELLYTFHSGYINTVIAMFLRGLYITLWSLLLFIPGIIKSYEYLMLPYILAENPTMPQKRAFQISKLMMDDEKFNAFILDVSFVGWNFLAIVSMNVVGIFWVTPYHQATYAELYAVLRQKALNSGNVGLNELPGFSE